ncbi:hypothetical protein DUI87_19533 [Hirundo rustica rustica]|uniref:Uncharacterized protein n=1 Tax=Hirundo rustica rustica TaxID=333673 RepID=A0A3M0JY59_HIRRU|nr:hypothetical protein DUI87_19533 [Hirundo rustica rustica]
MPTAPPEWGQNNEEGRKHMNEYRNLIIKGIKEAAPRGQNAKKAFEAQQEKEESPTEWLDRLRKNMKQYSGIDPETVGKALLRINFVTNAWPDIRKKLEKIEDWHNKSLDDLLKEAQKVYVRRDEEKAKLKAKLMAVAMRKKNFQKNQKHTGTTSRDKINRDQGKEKNRIPIQTKSQQHSRNVCFYCRGDKYHLEPVITLKVGPQEEELEFVVDTGAERTCLLNVPKGYSVSKDTAKVTGAKGETFTVPVIKDVVIEGETKIWVGDVLLVPKAGSNLLGRDLQVKLGIGVIPEDEKMTAKVLKLGQEDEEKINKEVWAGEGNRGGLNIDPISVTIEREDCPIRVRQYPISLEGREGLKPVIEGLIKDRTLEPCMSPHNTPILPVKKPDGSYRLVQDLREVNKRTRSRYPVVPNPYTLLSKVPPQHQWFSVVDLKDAFWACPLAKESRDIFAFEGEDPKTGRKQQLRWTKLPQGFMESPNLFRQALEKILQAFPTPPRIQIIQYVDDLLLSGEDEAEVKEATIKLFNFLGEKGLKKKPFHLYVNVEKGVAHGVLVQEWGGVKRPVAYLSKMLDPVSHGWPVCIQAIAATAILVEESRKLTFGGQLIVCTPHAVRNVLNQKAEKWLTDSRMLKYEAILIDSDDLTLEVNKSLNPAQFFYGEPADNLIHNCLEIIQYQTKVRGDLEEQALSEGEIIYVDGSSRCLQGKRMSGYAVVDGKNMQTIEKGRLPSNWSAQTCELYALKKALEYLAHKKGTIYTDSNYAFRVVHTFGKIWEERGLLNSRGKGLVHEGLILEILEALKLPEEIAIVHIKGHQRGVTPEIRGNNLADQEAKDAAENGAERVMLILTPNEKKLEIPKFSEAEKKELNKIRREQAESGNGNFLMEDNYLIKYWLEKY